MPRPARMWFRKQTGWWMVELDDKQIKLSRDKAEADKRFHQLMAVRHEAPESPHARVADIVESFLSWAETHVKPVTYAQYKCFGQKLAEHSGKIRAAEIRPHHVTRWAKPHGWS